MSGGADDTVELTPRATGSDPAGPPPRALGGRLSTGDRVGRYEIQDVVGLGGMGVVYRAWDTQLQRPVALKTLRAEGLGDETARLRLLREARTASQVHHPNIVELYDCFEEGGQIWLTMRLITGMPLSRHLRERGPLPPEEAARLALELARGLAHAHALGVIHRDIKPANVLLDQGHPVLTDFGLARALTSLDQDLTRDSQILGTPSYLAPELIHQGSTTASPASDQYALGVVLYEMLAGRPPVRGESPHEILAAIVANRQDPLPSTVPFQLAWICSRAMERRPQSRFPEVGAFADALERFLRGERVMNTRQNLERIGREAARHLRLPSLVLGGLLLAFGAQRVGASWMERREAGARAERAEARRAAMEARVTQLRAEGKREQASALFKSFAEFPENRETAALARAWLGEATRLAEDGEEERAEQALTQAYGLTTDPALQVEVLVALARSFRAHDEWDRLRSVLAVLARREDAPEDALVELRRDLAASEGDVVTARALNQDAELAPLLGALGQVTALGVQASTAYRLDDDADGRPELGIYRRADRSLTLFEEGRPSVRARLDLSGWAGDRFAPLTGEVAGRDEEILLLQDEQRCALGHVRGGAVAPLWRGPCVFAVTATTGDVDGDGVQELFFGDNRTLRGGHLGDQGELPALDSSINHANSETRGLQARDLDGDGRVELAVATGGWGAYDLRVLRPEGARWSLVDREQLGELRGLLVAREGGETLLAALQYADPKVPLDLRVFGADLPHAAPRGAHLFAWEGGRLEPRGLLPLPTPPTRPISEQTRFDQRAGYSMHVGDLDGDGDDEIALGYEGVWTWIYRRGEDGRWVVLSLDGWRPLVFVDLDADGDDELVLRETDTGLAYAIGVGSGALPRGTRVAASPRPPPEGLDPDLRAAWGRAEDLVALGMTETAMERILALVDLAAGTPGHGDALLRAAEIAADHDPAEALRLYERAAEEHAFAAPALEAAFALHDRAQRRDAAIAVGERRVALPDPPPALRARLEVLRARAATAELDLVSPGELHPAWRFDRPEAPRVSPEGMRLRWAGDGALARLPVRWLGGAVSIEVTARTDRQDWSSGLHIGLSDQAGAPQRGLSLSTTGGGGIFAQTIVCTEVPGTIPIGTPPAGPARIRWTYDPDERKETCSLEDEAGVEHGRTIYDTIRGAPPTEGWLTIWLKGEGAVSEIMITDLRLSGFAIRESSEPPTPEANARLARGDAAGALALLDEEPSLARILALDALGRPDERDRAMHAALARDPTLGGARTRLLLLAPERFARAMREALGPGWSAAVLEAYELLTVVRSEEPQVQRALTALLPELSRAPASPQVVVLLTRRAEAWRRLGQATRAADDATRAIQLARQLGGADLRAPLAQAQVQLAIASLTRGDAEGAMGAVIEALRVAPAPEVLADILAHRPELSALATNPRWATVEAVREGRPLSP